MYRVEIKSYKILVWGGKKMKNLDNYKIQVGEKAYKGKRLQDITVPELDAYLGRLEEWDDKYKTSRVKELIIYLREYLNDPIIQSELREEEYGY